MSLWLGSAALALLAGCSTSSDVRGDAPQRDLTTTPDALVKAEPIDYNRNKPYTVGDRTYTPMTRLTPFTEKGTASWYGNPYHGKKTSLGERYDMYAMTAAHPTLPLPSYIRVTNLENNKSVVLRVIDRGPFKSDRIVDVSYAAAVKLGFAIKGSAQVSLELLMPEDAPPAAAVAAPAPPAPTPAAPLVASPVATTVTPPATSAAATLTVTPAAQEAPGIYLQLGAFSREDNARATATEGVGKLPWMQNKLRLTSDGKLYRLRVGPYPDRPTALVDAQKVHDTLGIDPIISGH